MSELSIWFSKEVSRWRSGAALVWIIVLTPPIVYTAVALASFRLLHPITWLMLGVLRVLTVWTWPYMMLIGVCMMVFCVHTNRELSVTPTVHGTRWARLCTVWRAQSLYSLVWTAVLCGLIAWSYLRLVQDDYHTLTLTCPHDQTLTCFNEPHIFIILHCVYVGLTYKMAAFCTGHNQLLFPLLQQSKFFQMKRSAASTLVKASAQTFHRLKYYYVLYYFCLGRLAQNFFVQKFSVQLGETRLDSLSGLLDVLLLWHCLVSGCLTLVLLVFSTQLLKLYHTEWHQFPVETTIQKYQNLCLHNALSCHSNVFVQFHGYQDLCMLAKHSPSRRQQIFSLTQLGGHPQNWANISKESLGLLRNLLDDIKAYNVKAMGDSSMKHLAGESALTTGGTSTNGLTQRHLNKVESISQTSLPPPKTNTTIQMIMADLKKKKFLSFFLTEDPDTCSRKLLLKSQLYIWAVEALSHLVCASYEEDKYGVVQKTLPDIVDTLLNLQEQIEKHFRLVGSLSKRAETECDEDQEAALRTALKNTVKAALYRIIKTFNIHIRSIPLSVEHNRRLGHFLDYKE